MGDQNVQHLRQHFGLMQEDKDAKQKALETCERKEITT